MSNEETELEAQKIELTVKNCTRNCTVQKITSWRICTVEVEREKLRLKKFKFEKSETWNGSEGARLQKKLKERRERLQADHEQREMLLHIFKIIGGGEK